MRKVTGRQFSTSPENLIKIAFNITANLPNKRIIILVHYEYVHFCYILVYVTQCVHDTIVMDFSK